MATDKNTIKNWFRTGLKPTQAQFWAWMDSYWHKDEKIPITAIDDIENILAAKMDTQALAGYELKSQKGVASGYAPLNEFVKLSNEYLTIVNDFVTGGATALASAETVKVLKSQIDGINALLASDNINLDTVQEIVDAIEVIQGSLGLILVNDLTTGGTTKALTAEMGKTLKGIIDSLDGNVVHKTGNETIYGIKTFFGPINQVDPLNIDRAVIIEEGVIKISHNGIEYPARLLATTITDVRDIELPNQSGTITLNDNPSSITAPAFYSSSDKRLKNIIDKDYGDVSDLQAVAFTWQAEDKETGKQLGYIAQEVQKIMPSAVSKNTAGFLSVNYIAVLVAKIEALEKRVKQLEK